MLFPDTIDGQPNVPCFAVGENVFDLEPGESRLLLEREIHPTVGPTDWRERLAGGTYWIQAALIPPPHEGLLEEQHIDIGWVRLTQSGK